MRPTGWETSRWVVSIQNLMFDGVMSLVFTVTMGFILAVLMDQKIRFEDTFRTIMLYPFALSFIVTGTAWKWLLDPGIGIEHTMHLWGWTSFHFDWIKNRDLPHFELTK